MDFVVALSEGENELIEVIFKKDSAKKSFCCSRKRFYRFYFLVFQSFKTISFKRDKTTLEVSPRAQR